MHQCKDTVHTHTKKLWWIPDKFGLVSEGLILKHIENNKVNTCSSLELSTSTQSNKLTLVHGEKYE